ncbi:MAG TPA: twin-arginine translocation signal domain-containing protein, partial [bacterium]|nr:twin-arginine translocation signal domain-containing protein [bacterium]
MKHTQQSRRQFLRTLSFGAAGLGLGVSLPAARYGRIQGSNDRLQVGVMGTHSRGHALARGYARLEDAEVTYICDVDSRAVDKTVAAVQEIQASTPKGVKDFRQILDDQSLDALIIATPDHWHA